MNTFQSGYDVRHATYEQLHGINSADFQALVLAMDGRDGLRVLDLMCGYGAVSREILRHAATRAVSLDMVLVDLYSQQLVRSIPELAPYEQIGYRVDRIQADARHLPMAEASLDRVIIKMGLHEVPHADQHRIIGEAYRVLRPGGLLLVWEMLLDPADRPKFSAIMECKDTLSGLTALARNRYWPSQDDLDSALARFGPHELVRVSTAPIRTANWLDSDLRGDEAKLAQWNSFICSLLNPEEKLAHGYQECGNAIELQYQQAILRATKAA